MARIPEEEIERLKREVSLVRLAEARGIELAPHGKDLVGRCCFHSPDNTPSLVISPDKNLFNCLGACQAGGSVIDWVMRAEGVSFRHAVELLREGYPSLSTQSGRDAKAAHSRKLPSPVAADSGDADILRQVVAYYHETLKASPEALAYLERRGIRSDAAIDVFKLGFANRTLGLRLPIRATKDGERIRGRLDKLGILRESGHEHLSGSLVIPIMSPAGEVLGMYGRKITSRLREGTPQHLYLPGPRRGVWNEPALAESKEIILCEALIDALSFWCAGFRNVTTSWGVNGFADDHEEAFKRHGTKRVLIAYDRDDAGEKAAESLAPRLLALGIEVLRVQFPKGMDANDFSLKVTPASRALGLAVRKALWMGRGAPPANAPDSAVSPECAAAPATAAAKEEKQQPPREDCADPPATREESAPAVPPSKPVSRASFEPPPGEVSSLAAAFPPPEGSASQGPPAESSLRVDVKEAEIVLSLEERRWRIRGLAKNASFEQLKVNVLVGKGDLFHVDTLDLYSAKQRQVFAAQAAREIGLEEETLRKDLGRVLLKLEELHDEELKRALEPRKKAVTVSQEEAAAALALLKDPKLTDRILADFERCGVVGEETNKLVGYLAALSRKLDEPLAIVIQSSSAAGKSSLMEAVLAFVPEEERIKYSAMTGQSLFYVGEQDLAHKILAIVEEQGAQKASYSLKLLQSEGELSIASTGKDPATGRLVTHEYRVKGPVMIFLTTTAPEIDEELLNRCIILTVDEDREQTRAIHRLQRERQTLAGLLARQDRAEILKLHQSAQRLLRPLLVANPFARELTFLDDRTRTRRDHVKYLTLIRTIALLHQHQREIRKAKHAGREVEYIEATVADISLANRLAHQVLGRSLDELPPQTRRLLGELDRFLSLKEQQLKKERSELRFTRREVRERIGWGNSQLKLHLARLVELEYLIVHNAQRGQSFVYELLYDGKSQQGAPFLPGLIDPAKLVCDADRPGSDGGWPGSEVGRPGSGRASAGAWPGGVEAPHNDAAAAQERRCGEKPPPVPENAHLDGVAASHVDVRRSRTRISSSAARPSSLAARLSP
jgi:DNA primase catalytic core